MRKRPFGINSRRNSSPTIDDALDVVTQIFGSDRQLPCTLLVVDEVQQFIGEKIQRAMDVQEIAEHCCTTLNQRLLLIGTGQSALNTTPSLQRLQARFKVSVQLSDTDVESVIRKTVLRKKPERERAIAKCLDANQGELARHLENTRFAANDDDDKFFVADYPLLPTRRRFWEKVLRNTDHSGAKAQLRSQLQIVFEATRQTAAASVGTVVPADFIYDQVSTDLINSGELEREYNEIILKQRDGTKDGDLRSSLCALSFPDRQTAAHAWRRRWREGKRRNAGGPARERSEERPSTTGAASPDTAHAARRCRSPDGGGIRIPSPDSRRRALDP